MQSAATAVLPGGVVRVRPPWSARLNAWRKRSPFNPYWLELHTLRVAVAELARSATGTLLDVGVGERPWGGLFTGRVRRYIGLEYPPVADNLSPGIWSALHRLRGVVDVFGDGGRLPFRDGSFDTLLAVEVIEHLRDAAPALDEFARVLRPGGRLLLTAPFAAARHQLPYDFARFTPEGLAALLERHGFAVERMLPRGNTLVATGSMLAHSLIRTLATRALHKDGSASLSRWRAPFVLPLVATVQSLFGLLGRLTSDEAFALGYAVVARRCDDEESRSSNASSGRSTTSQS